MKTNKLIIVEPSPIISAGLIRYLEDINQIQIVSVLDSAESLQEKIVVHNPDLLIINPLIIGYNNINFFRQFTQNNPNILCVALITTYIDRVFLKNFKDTIELTDSKQKVVNKIINLLNNNEETTNQNDTVELSNRETEVLVRVAKGMTNKDISEVLNISVHTVITHRKNIVKKTGIKSVSGLTVYALLNNLIDESDIN